MPHLHRFLVPRETPREGTAVLPEEEAHHAARVVRLRPGEAVELFDGAGGVWEGHIAEIGKRDASVHIAGFNQTPPPLPEIVLLQALLQRPAAMEQLIEQGTVLGVTRFVFFRSARSEKGAKPSEKFRRWMIEACKQCGRAWLPEFETTDSLEAALAAVPAGVPKLVATLDRAPVACGVSLAGASGAAAIIGPEGDFTEAELSFALAHGARPIALGPYTLRAETAAVLAVALAGQALGRFG